MRKFYFFNESGSKPGINYHFKNGFIICLLAALLLCAKSTQAQRQMENLNRGVVALKTSANHVYVGWRLLGTDPADIAFNVYQGTTKLNDSPIFNSTNFIDSTASGTLYSVKAVINGAEEDVASSATVANQPYFNVPLQIPPGGVTPVRESYTYAANDVSIGDLDGDGEYDIVLKWDPSNSKDNSQSGYTGNVYIDAYKLNGTRLWRINLGKNIRAGAHYTQVMVYDLDGDGRAEVACRTSDGTVDGTGALIGDPLADHRNSGGYILTGPEFLTIFNGLTGKAMASTAHLPVRGDVCSWGNDGAGRPECYGNRVDRFVSAIAYLDGQRPSLIVGRGYYDKLVRAAWDWRDGQLTLRWLFDSKAEGNNAYSGQGNHQMTIADVDGDGKDEILNGSSAIDDNGTGLWSNRLGHADALHLSDLDPDRPGLEIWMPYEGPAFNGNVGAALLDASTGAIIWKRTVASGDIGRAMTADIDPNFRGNEMWAAGATGGLFDSKGNQIATTRPSINFGVWWDADLSRELLDGNRIDKWNPATRTAVNIFTASGSSSINGTKATPVLSADLFGDWREEVIWRTNDNSALRIYSTTISAANRFYTFMHDSQYRMAIAWQNSAYNQPPHPSFYIGTDMTAPPPTPPIEVVETIGIGDGHYQIKPVSSGLCLMANGTVQQLECDATTSQVWRISKQGGFYEIYSAGEKKYLGFDQLARDSPIVLTNESSKKLFNLVDTGEGRFQITPATDTSLVLSINEDGLLFLSANMNGNNQQFTFSALTGTTDCNGDWNGNAFRDDCNLCVGGNTARSACDVSITTGVYTIKPSVASFCIQAGDPIKQQVCDGAVDAQVWHITKVGSVYEFFSRETQRYLGYTSSDQGVELILTSAKAQYIIMRKGENVFSIAPVANLNVVITVTGDIITEGQSLQLSVINSEPSQNFSFEKVTTNIDCNGVWKGAAFVDKCGVCAAGNTGRQPCVTTLISGRYRIRPVHSSLCLTPGATLTQQVCSPPESNTQEWRLNKIGSFYEISSVSTGQFLGYTQPVSGAVLTFTDALSRKLFRIENAPNNGSFFIYPSDNLNIRFDVTGRSVNPGATIVLFNNGTNTNQRFYLEFKPEKAAVSFSDVSRVYSGLPAPVTVTTVPAGLMVNVRYNGQNIIPVNAGIYHVTATVQDTLYAGSAQDTLVIHKAPLTVTADNKSRPFAEENPPLTITYSGFVNGEDLTVLDSIPVIYTSATKDSPNGVYPIAVSNGADNNYALFYQHGTLTVFGQPFLKAQYRIRNHENLPYDNHIKPHFQIVNTGSESVKYTDITIRYWYTKEGTVSQAFWCDYAALGTSKVKGNFVTMDSAAANADTYLEISFTSTSSLMSNGNSGEIQTRFNKVNWSDYNETDDYSFDPAKVNYTDPEKITLYYKGVLVWGNEPFGSGNDDSTEAIASVGVYPNPFQSAFAIKAEGSFTYTIFDQYGGQKETGYAENECTAGSNLDRGLYHIQILNRQGSFSKRMIKE